MLNEFYYWCLRTKGLAWGDGLSVTKAARETLKAHIVCPRMRLPKRSTKPKDDMYGFNHCGKKGNASAWARA